jgi:hypothetical protein
MKNQIKRLGTGALTFGLAISWTIAQQKPQWKGSITKEGDVTVVKNPKEPMFREPIITLKEELIMGGGKAQVESTLSKARGIAVDDDGNIYVGDAQQACIKVFDKAGAYLRTIGRRGQGPGEMSWVESVRADSVRRPIWMDRGTFSSGFWIFGNGGEFFVFSARI